jgi:hypothetical protein
MAPVPVPPHVFEVDAGVLRFGTFTRRGGGCDLDALTEVELLPDTFQTGPLGGPLRLREAFDGAIERVIAQAEAKPAEASLVLPDRWLRLLFTDLEEEMGRAQQDDILRWKLKKLVPFRVEELRLRAAVVPGFPGPASDSSDVAPAGSRVLLAFAIEQLLRDLEGAFQARGVRVGQVASRSLYLMSLLRERVDASVLAVLLEADGYCLVHLAGGVPYVVRYRALQVDPGDPAQAANVAQDLRILLGFLEEHLPRHAIDDAVVCGPPAAAAAWIAMLNDDFGLPGRALGAADLPVATPAAGTAWHQVAALVAAATREVA